MRCRTMAAWSLVCLLVSGCAILRQEDVPDRPDDAGGSGDDATTLEDSGFADDAPSEGDLSDDPDTELPDTNQATRYEAAVLADEPVGYWRLNELSTPTAFDSSGNEHHGLFKGVPALGEPGPFDDGGNTAVVFDGSQQIDVEGVWSPMGKQPFTVEAWVHPTGEEGAFLGHGDYQDMGGYTGYRFSIDPDPMPTAFRFNRGSNDGTARAGPVDTTGWQHVAAVFDGVNIILYRNGEIVDDATSDKEIPEPQTPFTIGDATNWGGFEGGVDEVALYDRALGLAELIEHYEAAQ